MYIPFFESFELNETSTPPFSSRIERAASMPVKSDFEAEICPAPHTLSLRYAEYTVPLESIASKAPSVESPVFMKANLEYAGIEKRSLIKIGAFPIVPKQLPLDGKSAREL